MDSQSESQSEAREAEQGAVALREQAEGVESPLVVDLEWEAEMQDY